MTTITGNSTGPHCTIQPYGHIHDVTCTREGFVVTRTFVRRGPYLPGISDSDLDSLPGHYSGPEIPSKPSEPA
jgi:hypothetical protein